jgi:hypothetical protein
VISEEQAFQQMSPVDQLRVPSPRVGPEQAAANRQQNARDLLSIVPGPGNVIAAEDAHESFGNAADAIGEGRYGRAALHGGLGVLSGVGAITGLPFGRMAGNAARDASHTLRAWQPGYFHGTTKKFKNFKPGGEASNQAVFATPDKEFAGMFADGPRGKVHAVEVEDTGFADLANQEHIDRIAQSMAKKLNMPLDKMKETLAGQISNGRLNWASRNSVDAVREAGFRGVHLNDAYDVPSVAVFDPAQMRIVRQK